MFAKKFLIFMVSFYFLRFLDEDLRIVLSTLGVLLSDALPPESPIKIFASSSSGSGSES